MRLSLFVSIFFECCQRKNKFSPLWVYSQWDKLDLIIVSHRLAKSCRIIQQNHRVYLYNKVDVFNLSYLHIEL